MTSVITFDFYGTLVQWHEALDIAFREMLVRRGLPTSGTAALASDFAAEGRRLRDTPPWKPYREVLRDSVVFALKRAGLAAQDVGDTSCTRRRRSGSPVMSTRTTYGRWATWRLRRRQGRCHTAPAAS